MIKSIIEKRHCPHCGHTKAVNKTGVNITGVFCTKCGKENKGFITKLNKHKKQITIPVI